MEGRRTACYIPPMTSLPPNRGRNPQDVPPDELDLDDEIETFTPEPQDDEPEAAAASVATGAEVIKSFWKTLPRCFTSGKPRS
jgi:hypothetical protein